MEAKVLRELMRAEPFQPFRVHLVDGSHYDIPARGWMAVTRHAAAVGVKGKSDSVPNRLVTCAVDQITCLEVPIRIKKRKRRNGNRG